MLVIVISLVRSIVSAATGEVSEPSVHHALVNRKVDDEFLLTVVNTCELRLLGLALHNLHLLHHLCRKVLRSQLRVIKEECLAVNGDLSNGLAIRRYAAVGIHFYSRKLLEQILEHIIVGSLE